MTIQKHYEMMEDGVGSYTLSDEIADLRSQLSASNSRIAELQKERDERQVKFESLERVIRKVIGEAEDYRNALIGVLYASTKSVRRSRVDRIGEILDKYAKPANGKDI